MKPTIPALLLSIEIGWLDHPETNIFRGDSFSSWNADQNRDVTIEEIEFLLKTLNIQKHEAYISALKSIEGEVTKRIEYFNTKLAQFSET